MASVSTTGKMPVTMVHLNMVEGIDPVLQVAEGYTVDLPTEVDKTLLDRTDPTWPSTWFAPILTCIRSWPTGAPTTERGPTAIWGRTCPCTTFRTRRFTDCTAGRRSAQTIRRAPTTAPAPRTARCIAERSERREDAICLKKFRRFGRPICARSLWRGATAAKFSSETIFS